MTSGAARLGIEVEKLSGALADQLNLPKGKGLLVTSVKADSPAARAGLKVNDVLLKLGKQEVPGDAAQLARRAGQALALDPRAVAAAHAEVLARWDYAASWRHLLDAAGRIVGGSAQ